MTSGPSANGTVPFPQVERGRSKRHTLKSEAPAKVAFPHQSECPDMLGLAEESQ